MSRVEQTRDVEEDVWEIGRYIAQRSGSLDVALQFLDRIDEKCLAYARQPEMGDPRPDLGADARMFRVDSYVVVYRPTDGGIQLLLVAHGSRDYEQIVRERLDRLE